MTPSARIHRVTTRRQHLRALSCPLEPELLVAEFAGELPPDVAQAVREHIAICETCGGRSQALRAPYKLLASLGNAPVPFVPDMRDDVKVRVHSFNFVKNAARGVAKLGRGGTLVLTGVLGLAVLIVVLAGAVLYPALAGMASRSKNGLSHVPAAAPHGVVYVETNKLIPITDASGATWQVAEVIAVDQHTGAVIRSMPEGGGALHVGSQQQLPLTVVVGGGSVVELTAPGSGGKQAIIIFDAATGKVRSATAIRGMTGVTSDQQADALTLSPDGKTAYVGLSTKNPTVGTRVVALDVTNGSYQRTLAPGFTTDVPMPPPPGSLPPSAFPTSVPHLDASQMTPQLGLNGALVASPDGQWLFDVLLLQSGDQQYAVIRRFDAQSGALAQELAVQGTFTLAQLAVNNRTEQPQVYLVTGSPDVEAFVLDAGTTGPLLQAEVPLGGPALSSTAHFVGTLTVSPTADGTHLLVSQDGSDAATAINGHDLWLVDTQAMGLNAHRSTGSAAGIVLANTATGAGVKAFVLEDGQINLFDASSLGDVGAWLRLSDGQPVIRLLGTAS